MNVIIAQRSNKLQSVITHFFFLLLLSYYIDHALIPTAEHSKNDQKSIQYICVGYAMWLYVPSMLVKLVKNVLETVHLPLSILAQ